MAIHPEIARIINIIDHTAQRTHHLGLKAARDAYSDYYFGMSLGSVFGKTTQTVSPRKKPTRR
jgi:hypothetical protein